MRFKKIIINIISIIVFKKKWKKFIRLYLKNFKLRNFLSIFKREQMESCNFLIIDDYFPLKEANTWRSVEFHEYFKRISDAKFLNISDYFYNKYVRGMPCEIFNSRLKSYLNYKPKNENRISQIKPNAKYYANLAYLLFFNNISLMLPWLEKNKIPFVFCLYPGGGFCPDNEDRDRELKKIFSSKMFRKVIVTQNFTKNYLIKKKLCKEDYIKFVFGCFSQIEPCNSERKKKFLKEKKTFDICFVANKYSECSSHKKGLDIFLEVAITLSSKYNNMHFHVVGNWECEVKPYLCNKNLHFYATRPAEFFPKFYSKMDIFLSPNRSFKELRKMPNYLNNTLLEFDGFPLGMDAGMCGVALFVTDELNHTKGYFKNADDIVIIGHDVTEICKKIIFYYNNPEKLYSLANKEREKFINLFNTETQINERLEVLNEFLP